MKSHVSRRYTSGAGTAFILAGALLGFTAVGADAPRFGRSVTLPDIGLTIRLMHDAAERPLPPPRTYTYRRTQGDASELIELFDPIELWKRSQHGGEWTDPAGNRLVLAQASGFPPAGLPTPHAPREDIEKALNEQAPPASEWTEAQLARWINAFTGADPSAPLDLNPRVQRFANLLLFEFKGSDRLAYAFRLNRRMLGFSAASDNWFVTILEPAGGTRLAAREAMEKTFLPNLAPVQKSARSKTTGSESSAFTDRARRPTSAPAATLDESRRMAAESIRNMRGWWTVSTERYVFLSNLETSMRGFVRALQSDVETLRNAFENAIPSEGEITAAVVRMFATAKEYEDYIPAEQRWTGGLWVPSRGELVIRPLPEHDRQTQHEAMLRTVYHEAFHQYIHYAMDRRVTSAWFNEGHAVFFENAVIRTGRPVEITESQANVARIQDMIRRNALAVERLLAMKYEDFYAADAAQRGDNYALAWGLVYYLRKGAPATRSPHAAIPGEYVRLLRETGDADKATREAFARVNMESFHKELSEFWTSSRDRRAAERYRQP